MQQLPTTVRSLSRFFALGFAFLAVGFASSAARGQSSHALRSSADSAVASFSVFQPVPNPAPTLTQVSPNQVFTGSIDTAVLLVGTGFVPRSVAVLGSMTLTTFYYSPTELVAVVPASMLTIATAIGVRVANPTPGGGNSQEVLFVVTNPTPTLTSLSPAAIVINQPDTTVTITGVGFDSGAKASADNVNLATTFISSTQLSVVVPAFLLNYLHTMDITVTDSSPSGGTSAPLSLSVELGQATLALVSAPDNHITRTAKSLVVAQVLQNTSINDAYSIQITGVTLNGTGNSAITPAGQFNISTTGGYGLFITFPLSAAARGTTPTLSVTYTSLNAGTATLTFVCPKVP